MQAINTANAITTGLTANSTNNKPNCRSYCAGTCAHAKNNNNQHNTSKILPACAAIKNLLAANKFLPAAIANA